MEKRIIYRGPVGRQDRFVISVVWERNRNVRRQLELCKDMNFNMMNFTNATNEEAYSCAIACEEVALVGIFQDMKLDETFDYAIEEKTDREKKQIHYVSISDADFSAEKLRMEIYKGIIDGALGVEIEGLYDGMITKDNKRDMLFHYIKEMNYRICEYGRTLMALTPVKNTVLEENGLPEDCTIGNFEDKEGNHYMMVQNQNHQNRVANVFFLNLKKNYHIYRVNPHTGQQMLVKKNVDNFKVLVMPGDIDLLRFQDADEEAYLIEYALKK